jgi:UDP-glucuronate 4-epimerase
MTSWLVTGAAGFVGFHVADRLLRDGERIVGIDNMSPYYDPSLKEARIKQLEGREGFEFLHYDLSDREVMASMFSTLKPDVVVHLGAQPGVRYSLQNPHSYSDSNLLGFLNVLEGCRHNDVSHLVYASSSSVYGANSRIPFSTRHGADHPVSLYAATKRANELMAHSYSHLYGLPVTGLRFFTVYGPWGRPDMAYYRFTEAIFQGEPVVIYGDGSAMRDFTYVDDVVEGIVRVARIVPEPSSDLSAGGLDPSTSTAPYRLFNIGHGDRITVSDLIDLLERLIGREAEREYEPQQPGDLLVTQAEVHDLAAYTGFTPRVGLDEGMESFTDWYKSYTAR